MKRQGSKASLLSDKYENKKAAKSEQSKDSPMKASESMQAPPDTIKESNDELDKTANTLQ